MIHLEHTDLFLFGFKRTWYYNTDPSLSLLAKHKIFTVIL